LYGFLWLMATDISLPSPWYIQTVDFQYAVGNYTSLVLDANGYPHVSYRETTDSGEKRVKYAAWNGTSWLIQTLPNTYYPEVHCASHGTWTSLALDGSGLPHITFKWG